MRFALSEEQAMLAEASRGYLAGLPNGRAVLEGAAPPDWGRIVAEQGWPAIVIPEALGGFGMGWAELAVVFEELGRCLTPCPLLATSWATAALLSADDAVQQRWLPRIAEGLTAAVAWDPAIVVDGATAELLLLVSDGRLALLDAAERAPLTSLDHTRALARIQVHQCSDLGPVTPLVDARCRAMLAAECVGAAEATMELAVAYAGVRRQFGKPIGSFQAVQHLCADMLVAVESARSAAWFAAWACDNDPDAAPTASRTALATATDALLHCAGDSIQVHGGIGFTWEHDCHLYFKRAQVNRTLLGTAAAHRAAIADQLLGA